MTSLHHGRPSTLGGRAHASSQNWETSSPDLWCASLLLSLRGHLAAADEAAVERDVSAVRQVGIRRVLPHMAAALENTMRQALREAWLGGWQPADLVHNVVTKPFSPKTVFSAEMEAYSATINAPRGRVGRHSGQHPESSSPVYRNVPQSNTTMLGLLVTAMAEDVRAHPAGTVADITIRQIAEAARFARPATSVRQWCENSGEALPGALIVAARLTLMLAGLAPIEQLMPPPGMASHHSASKLTGEDTKVMKLVKNLLAKAEATTYPAEAESYLEAAQTLMSRHQIDEATLASDSTTTRGAPVGVRVPTDGPHATALAVLATKLAEVNNCRCVWIKRGNRCAIVGYPRDVVAVDTLYASLRTQAEQAMNRACAEKALPTTGVRGGAFRHSFLVAFAERVSARLAQARDAAFGESVGSRQAYLPVLASDSRAVQAAVEKAFGPLDSQQTITLNDARGWSSGTVAADLASISGHRAVRSSRF